MKLLHGTAWVLALCLLPVWPVSACEDGVVSAAERREIRDLYTSLLACRSLPEQDVPGCVSRWTMADTPEQLNLKMSKWLVDLDNPGELTVCPHPVTRLFPAAETSRFLAIRCASYTAFGRDDTALFYFSREDGRVKLWGIQKLRL